MGRLAQGDREAFAPLYEALRPRAARLARLRLGEHEGPDVAQAALLKVFTRASDFTPGRACLPWFYAIVANEVQAVRRRRARFVSDNDAADALVSDGDPEAELVVRELERALELAIESLDADAAEAIRAALGRAPLPPITAPAFRKRLSRAYAKLRLLLGGQDVG
jgi:RNA polymerase sigma-70 factor (ECF subfamily)